MCDCRAMWTILRLRRSLGFKLEWPGHLLHQLLAYLDATGAATLTAELMIEWARRLRRPPTPPNAVSAVRDGDPPLAEGMPMPPSSHASRDL
jgi:hypothetical protein